MAKAQKDVKGQGSIVQFEKDKPKSRCRKWQLRVSTGKDPRTSKYITKTRTFHGSYTEATKALRGFIEEIEQDKIKGRTAYTFEEYRNRCLERREAKKEVAPTTLKRQGCQFKAACHHIGGLRLEEVTPSVLEDVYVAMMQGETLSGKKSGGSYVNQVHDNITLVFEAAKNEGLLVTNPCDGSNPPKMDTKAKKAIEPAKVHELIGELDPSNHHECARLFAIALGPRRT